MTALDTALHVADVYADVIYDLAGELSAAEEVKGEIELLAMLIAQERDFLYIMSSPQFSADYKQSLLQMMFEGKISDLTFNFLLTVGRHNRMVYLPQIIARFGEIWDAHHGLSIVELTVSENLSANELNNARD